MQRGLDGDQTTIWTPDECQAVASARRVVEADRNNDLDFAYQCLDAEDPFTSCERSWKLR